MSTTLLTTHAKQDTPVKGVLLSIVLHLLIVFLIVGFGALLPAGPLIDLGSVAGGGQGESVRVALSASVQDGGFGAVKPSPRPAARTAPPPKKKTPVEKPVDDQAFVEKVKKPQKAPKKLPSDRPPLDTPVPLKPQPGDVVRKPDPGTGGEGRKAAGLGGGFGIGVGVESGDGRNGHVGLDSFYVRLVERRVGENWLRNALGDLGRPVESIYTFRVLRNGRISDIELVTSSGISSVDLAAQRAIRASDPLPPLPPEFRGSAIRFRSEFRYPPR